jgi:hypothetical protein
LNTFDTFAQRYLREWDKRATVRTRQRWRLPAEIDIARLFPLDFQPIAKHAAVIALGEKTVHEVLVRTLCKFQGEVAHLETEIVGALCGRLAGGTFGFPLPASVRQVARTIGVDEFYHSYLAREFIADLSRHTGIDPGPLPGWTYPLATALTALRRDADPAILGDAEIMALCFAENFVTEELFGLVKNTPKDTAFHVALREHLVDEGRHQIFFQMSRPAWRWAACCRAFWTPSSSTGNRAARSTLAFLACSASIGREVSRSRASPTLLHMAGSKAARARCSRSSGYSTW